MNTTQNKVQVSIKDFTKITREKAIDQFLEAIKISQCADIALMAHSNMDMDFQNPFIKNHLKRIKESSEAIKRELRSNKKYNLKSNDTEFTEDMAGVLFDFMTLSTLAGREYTQNLNEETKNHIETLVINI
jgi:hypothetical protein